MAGTTTIGVAGLDDARCWGCGYRLRGTASDVCPECGRAFDPADPATMNFGRPMGRLGRWMLASFGWGAVGVAAVGCALVLATTRWPVEGWRFSLMDLQYYGPVWAWRGRAERMTLTDGAYGVGVWLSGLAAVWVGVRVALRAYAVARYRPPGFQRGRVGRALVAFAVLVGLTFAGMGVGWPYRLGQRWVASAMGLAPVTISTRGRPVSLAPGRLSTAPAAVRGGGEAVALLAAAEWGWDQRTKIGAIKLMVEERTQAESVPSLLAAAACERDPVVKALELRLLGTAVSSGTVPRLLEFTHDPDAEVRAAAADALGIYHRPRWPLDHYPSETLTTESDPPITLPSAWRWTPDDPTISLGARVRETLVDMITRGAAPAEREAAARGLVNWPRYTRFRYAEWGVFQADEVGRILTDARRQLADLPPFAHRLPEVDDELNGRLRVDRSMPVWKPVIHLTTDAPLAVDLEVCLAPGRPWVAYPRFDDLALVRATPERRISTNEWWAGMQALAPKPAPLTDLREGYPWLRPHHRTYPWALATGDSVLLPPAKPTPIRSSRTDVGGAGFHWQSLIVSPTRLPWMTPPDVGADPRFAWWRRLRDVECSWVSSRGESERFLYYDGAIEARAERAELKEGRLSMSPFVTGKQIRTGLYVSVRSAGVSIGYVANVEPGRGVDVSSMPVGTQAAAEAELIGVLCQRGLTEGEAEGFVACWREAFFVKPGRRYLGLLSTRDYDEMCPMTIAPQPTERVRVGIVWTELPAE